MKFVSDSLMADIQAWLDQNRPHTASRVLICSAGPTAHDEEMDALIRQALTTDLVILLINTRQGLLPQTRQLVYLAKLLGIPHVLTLVQMMDPADEAAETFSRIARNHQEYCSRIGLDVIPVIPIPNGGDGHSRPADCTMSWSPGPTLIEQLETLDRDDAGPQALRMQVQRVSWSKHAVGELFGTVASGVIRLGQRIRLQPSGRESTVMSLHSAETELDHASAPQCVSVTLADAVHVSAGDLISSADSPAEVADQFQATIVWQHEAPMLQGRSYLLKCGAQLATATVLPLRYKIDTSTLAHVAAEKLERHETGVVELELDRQIAFDPYRTNRQTGSFKLIDKLTNQTVGAGLLNFALRRADNIHWQALDVNKQARRALNGHGSGVVWLTGLSGAGKSTIANVLEKKLYSVGIRTYLLDGDNVRHGLNKDLGFTAADRVENIRRVAEVARLMVDAGIVVITAFISPFRAERDMARNLFGKDEFCEAYVKTPLHVAEARDVKGLYKKARSGQLKNFTGIDSPYEEPTHPEILIESESTSAEMAAQQIHEYLKMHFQNHQDGADGHGQVLQDLSNTRMLAG